MFPSRPSPCFFPLHGCETSKAVRESLGARLALLITVSFTYNTNFHSSTGYIVWKNSPSMGRRYSMKLRMRTDYLV